MEAKLVVVVGKASASEFSLALPTILGRSRGVSVVLGHPLISRQHCELFEKDGLLVVRDLGSLNGTFVGDQRITEETTLHPGHLLTLGPFTFRADYVSPDAMTVTGASDETPDFVISDTGSEDHAKIEPTIDFGSVVREPQVHANNPQHPKKAASESTEDGFDFNWLEEEPETAPEPARKDTKVPQAQRDTQGAKQDTQPAKKDPKAATKETTTIPKLATAKPAPSDKPAIDPDATIEFPAEDLSLDDLPLPDVDGLVDFGGTVQTPHGDNPAELALDDESPAVPTKAKPAAGSPGEKTPPDKSKGPANLDDDDFDFGEVESESPHPEGEKQSLSGFFKNLE